MGTKEGICLRPCSEVGALGARHTVAFAPWSRRRAEPPAFRLPLVRVVGNEDMASCEVRVVADRISRVSQLLHQIPCRGRCFDWTISEYHSDGDTRR